MSEVERDPVVAAAQMGDELAFTELVQRYRRELQVHCYRMLGSVVESEDLVQETFLKAWRHRESFQGRSTFRAWLYRIATNACLDHLARSPRRVLAYQIVAAADPKADSIPEPTTSSYAWLEPYPDHLLEGVASDDDPYALVVAKETIELAFLAAIQHLPPKQRAVMIMRDVLDWSANETAEVLELSVPAVKSALQRARATLREELPPERSAWAPSTDPSAQERAVLERYMHALEQDGTEEMIEVLREDVRVSYAPLPLYAQGRDDFVEGSSRFAPPGEYRCLPTRANRQPAVALYLRSPEDTEFRLISIGVLRVVDGKIAEICDYGMPEVLAMFDLPPTL